jgi:hypothetical protein
MLVKRVQSSIGFWAERGPWIKAWISQAPAIAHLWFLPGIGLAALYKRNLLLSPIGLVSLFGILQVATYTVQGAPSGYPWYMAPGNHAVVALNLISLSFIGELAVNSWFPSAARASRLGWGLLALLGGLRGLVEIGLARPYRLATDYQNAAQFIREHDENPNSTVACAEIGYMGFYTQRPILDMLGLLHERSLAPMKSGNLAWWYPEHPRWIVAHLPRWTGEPGFKGSSSTLSQDYALRWHSATLELWEQNKLEEESAPRPASGSGLVNSSAAEPELLTSPKL